MRLHALIAATLLGVAAWPARSANAQDLSPLEQRAVGCYVIDVGEWDPARHEFERSAQTPPSRIELLAERGTLAFENDQLLLRPVLGQRGGWGRDAMAYWRAAGRDTLALVWTNGYIGVDMRLGLRGDSIRGEATTFTDAHIGDRETPRAPVGGTRVACRDTTAATAPPEAWIVADGKRSSTDLGGSCWRAGDGIRCATRWPTPRRMTAEPVDVSPGAAIALVFEHTPADTTLTRVWRRSQSGIALDAGTFTAPTDAGVYTYMLRGVWSRGDAYYGFKLRVR